MKRGLTHIYHGDGKGKTTAAVGLCCRAAGAGLRVLFVQFFKRADTGEVHSLRLMPRVEVLRLSEAGGFTIAMSDAQRVQTKAEHTSLLGRAVKGAQAGAFDVIVLDEVLDAYEHDLVDRALLDEFIANKPEGVELVLTGRNPTKEMLAHADYVTNMKKVKHPYDEGIQARRGIEK